jgi:hypothetical protein
MAFPKKLKELCTPAFLYFSLAMIGILVSVVQNLGNSRRFDLGMLSARVPSTFLVFVVKIIYILFWTWVLNLMCKDGHKEIAWFLVLIPFVLLFLLMGSMMGGSSYEGFEDLPKDISEADQAMENEKMLAMGKGQARKSGASGPPSGSIKGVKPKPTMEGFAGQQRYCKGTKCRFQE